MQLLQLIECLLDFSEWSALNYEVSFTYHARAPFISKDVFVYISLTSDLL